MAFRTRGDAWLYTKDDNAREYVRRWLRGRIVETIGQMTMPGRRETMEPIFQVHPAFLRALDSSRTALETLGPISQADDDGLPPFRFDGMRVEAVTNAKRWEVSVVWTLIDP